MAKAKLTFTSFNYDDLTQSIKDQLALIDEAKAEINRELAAFKGDGWKAQHSYKLDFTEGKRVFKIAFYQATAKAKVVERPKMSLAEFVAKQEANGRSV